MDKEQALLSLKWLITDRIDGYWGAGDAHLPMLDLLVGLDPDDEKIKALALRLRQRSTEYDQRTAQEPDETKRKQRQEWKAENIYRDEGKEEATYYANLIKQKYGQEYFDKLEDTSLDWF